MHIVTKLKCCTLDCHTYKSQLCYKLRCTSCRIWMLNVLLSFYKLTIQLLAYWWCSLLIINLRRIDTTTLLFFGVFKIEKGEIWWMISHTTIRIEMLRVV